MNPRNRYPSFTQESIFNYIYVEVMDESTLLLFAIKGHAFHVVEVL